MLGHDSLRGEPCNRHTPLDENAVPDRRWSRSPPSRFGPTGGHQWDVAESDAGNRRDGFLGRTIQRQGSLTTSMTRLDGRAMANTFPGSATGIAKRIWWQRGFRSFGTSETSRHNTSFRSREWWTVVLTTVLDIRRLHRRHPAAWPRSRTGCPRSGLPSIGELRYERRAIIAGGLFAKSQFAELFCPTLY